MKFCPDCDNLMYYVAKSDELMFVCKNCNKREVIEAGEGQGLCVSKIVYRGNVGTFDDHVNEYTVYDPTYPRTDAFPCPKCNERVIIIVRYDADALKHAYMCQSCKYAWRMETGNVPVEVAVTTAAPRQSSENTQHIPPPLAVLPAPITQPPTALPSASVLETAAEQVKQIVLTEREPTASKPTKRRRKAEPKPK